MSTSTISLPAQARDQRGKADVRRIRRQQDLMPAVVYGAGKEAVSIAIEHRHILRALDNEAVYSQVLELDIDGKKESVVLKALQRHPYKVKILHADFLRIDAKQSLHMLIPLHFINESEAPGAKAGGVFTHTLSEVEVACLPSNLPEFIEVDLSTVELDSSVHLSDLVLPKGVELVALQGEEPQDMTVASVHMAKVDAEPVEEVVESPDEGAEPVADTPQEGDNSTGSES